MSTFKFVLLNIFVFAVFSCKQGEDPALKEALAIQDEAVHIGMDVDKLIREVMISDTSKENLMFAGMLKTKLVLWKKEMVVVPGLKNDHIHDEKGQTKDTVDHSGHNHEGHDHVHANGNEIGAHLSPSELKEVQNEWKNQILNLKDEVEKYKTEKGK